jgi:hypothetical protein
MNVKTIIASLLLSTTPAMAEPLPDGEVTRFGDWSAMLTGPTTRYAHGALGDEIEAAGFTVAHKGKQLHFSLDVAHVFEDRRVRLVQLDDDAAPEAVIIRSHLDEGAAIAIYDIGATITLKAQSENIGTRNRWLNIAGFGGFTGRGKTEIAAVITPHLAGSLRAYEIDGTELKELARIDGYTNHINGTRDLDLAEVKDFDGDGTLDIKLPRIDGSGKAVISFAKTTPRELPQ